MNRMPLAPQPPATRTATVTHEIEDTPPALDETELVTRLRRQFASPAYQPPRLPSVALEVLGLSHKANVPIGEIVSLLERDSFLAGRVIALARSPVYGGSMPVHALHPAVVRLGLSTVQQLVLEAAMNLKVFRADKYASTMDSVRKHSTTVAHLSRMIARFTTIEAEMAFLTGLIHDIGIAAALLMLGDSPDKKRIALTPGVWSAIDRVHTEASRLLATNWGLAPAVTVSVVQHHGATSGPVHPLASIIMMAEALAAENGAGITPQLEKPAGEPEAMWSNIEGGTSGQFERAAISLRLDGNQLTLIRKEAKALNEKLAQHG